MRTRSINEEVLYVEDGVIHISPREITTLKSKAQANARKRIRICTHRDVSDSVHEMLIVHHRDAYVPPHKHRSKPESFHIIEGRADVALFDEKGKLTHVIPMGDYASGKDFYYKITDPLYHILILQTEFLIVHETTSGPFRKEETTCAPWAPDEKNIKEAQAFMSKLREDVAKFRR